MAAQHDPVVLRAKLENIWDNMDAHYMATGKLRPAAQGTPLPGLQETVGEENLDETAHAAEATARAEHLQRTHAELGLLETFNAPRIDHCKAVPPAVRGTLTEASRETAYFGGPKAYVRSLPSKHFRDYKEGTLWRMHEMLGSKAQRHAEAVAAYNSERVEVAKHMKAAVQEEAAAFNVRLKGNDEDIEMEFEKLSDENISMLEIEGVQEVWTEVAAQFPVRHGWVAALQDTLAAVEADRQVIMRDTLAQLVAVVMDVASEGPGVIERLVEKEAVLVNHEMNANKRSAAELVRRLSRREVDLEKERLERWEARMAQWRRLRTLGAIRTFQALMAEQQFQDPPRRQKLIDRTLAEQDDEHVKLTAHVDNAHKLLPPRQLLTQPDVERWTETAEANSRSWDEAIGQGMGRLQDDEEELHSRAVAAYDQLVADVARYDGFPPEEQKQMLERDALVLVTDRQAAANNLLAYLDRSLQRQAAEWRSQWGRLSDWLHALASLHDAHKITSKRLAEASQEELDGSRAQHEANHAAGEGEFQRLIDVLKRSHDNKELEANVQEVLQHLEVIKESYRIFHTRSVGVCNRNPPIMDEDGNQYERALCKLLRLKFNCAPPPVEGEEVTQTEQELAMAVKDRHMAPPPSASADEEAAVVTAESGISYLVESSLFDALYAPPPPEPEPVEEMAAAEPPPPPEPAAKGKAKPKTPDKKGKPKTPPKEEEPTEEELAAKAVAEAEKAAAEAAAAEVAAQAARDAEMASKLPIAELPVARATFEALFVHVQTSLLTEMHGFQHGVVEFSLLWQTENIEELTIELDENLRRHRPRAGRVEEDVARAREVQLLEQARRANNFVKTNIRLVQKQQAEGLKTLGDEMNTLLARMTTVTEMLVTTPDANFLMVRLREMQKLKSKIAAICVKQCDTMRAALEVDEAELLKANFKLKELFRSFDEGGQYTEKAVAAVRARLDFIIEQAGLARHDVKLDCDELQEGTLKDSDARAAYFEEQLTPHRQDLVLIAEVDKAVALAKRKHREMLEASCAVAAEIAAETAALADTTRTAITERGSTAQGLCLKQLTALDSLRRLLKPRTQYLGSLKATVPTPKVKLDVHVHLETAAEAEAKRAAAEAEAAAAAAPEAGAGAPRGKTPPKGTAKAASARPASGKGATSTAADDAPEADEWEEETELPDLLGDTDRILTQGRERIQQLSEEYYTVTNNAERDDFRPITRTEPIPPTLEEMVAMHEKTFSALQVESEAHVEAGVREVRGQVVALTEWLLRVPGTALGNCGEEAMAAMSAEVLAVDRRYDARHRRTQDVQEMHKLALKPSLTPAEVDALSAKEAERAAAATSSVREHAAAAVGALERHAYRFGRALEKATRLTLKLLDAFVLPEDLSGMELDDHLKAMRRKNLRQLQRLLEGASAEGNAVEGAERVAAENRSYMRRTFKALDRQLLTTRAAGWDAAALDKVLGTAAVGEQGGEAAAETVAAGAAVTALDTAAQQGAVNARDRVFMEFHQFLVREVTEHQTLLVKRVRDEVAWKAIWDELVDKVRAANS